MAYFKDLSDYSYFRSECRVGTKNVGWIDSAHEFNKSAPAEALLALLWNNCKISVAQSRGIHDCGFCPSGTSYYVVRNDQPLFLGTAEIRVFAKDDGAIYAAPTLIYHYVSVHHYSPPEEFVRALNEGPRPPSQEYFDKLSALGLEWRETFAPESKPRRTEYVRSPDGKWERIELP